jgi:hypothetical protein
LYHGGLSARSALSVWTSIIGSQSSAVLAEFSQCGGNNVVLFRRQPPGCRRLLDLDALRPQAGAASGGETAYGRWLLRRRDQSYAASLALSAFGRCWKVDDVGPIARRGLVFLKPVGHGPHVVKDGLVPDENVIFKSADSIGEVFEKRGDARRPVWKRYVLGHFSSSPFNSATHGALLSNFSLRGAAGRWAGGFCGFKLRVWVRIARLSTASSEG